MTKKEYLLSNLMLECAVIQKASSAAMLEGVEDNRPIKEIGDCFSRIIAIIELLEHENLAERHIDVNTLQGRKDFLERHYVNMQIQGNRLSSEASSRPSIEDVMEVARRSKSFGDTFSSVRINRIQKETEGVAKDSNSGSENYPPDIYTY